MVTDPTALAFAGFLQTHIGSGGTVKTRHKFSIDYFPAHHCPQTRKIVAERPYRGIPRWIRMAVSMAFISALLKLPRGFFRRLLSAAMI